MRIPYRYSILQIGTNESNIESPQSVLLSMFLESTIQALEKARYDNGYVLYSIQPCTSSELSRSSAASADLTALSDIII